MTPEVRRPAQAVIEGFRELSTCNVSDALDKLGLRSGVWGIRPLYDCAKVVGPAITMRLIPFGPDRPSSHLGADALAVSQAGDLIVIDNGGRVDQNCWGEILTFAARQRGVAGVIIDGASRDLDVIREIEFPLYARAVVPHTARGRNVQGDVNRTVQLGGAQVRPGDVVMADVNGIAVIPNERAEEVLAAARELFDRENEIVRLLKAGVPFADVDRKSGYDRMLDQDRAGKGVL